MRAKTVIKEFLRQRDRVPELGERHILRNWILDPESSLFMDMQQYGALCKLLPDHIVENMEKARLSRDGLYPILRAGLGYSELLASTIVDGTAIASSSSEARLAPAIMLPANYLQPGGIPGRTLRFQMRGRVTTLTTSATMTFRLRDGATDAFTTSLAASGAIIMDAAAQTSAMWEVECHVVVRSVGSSGTVFAMGDADLAPVRFTSAAAGDRALLFMGSAGSTVPAAVTVDMTANRYWNLTGQWSLTTAYSIQSHMYLVEALN